MRVQKRFLIFLLIVFLFSVLALSGAYSFFIKSLGLRESGYDKNRSVVLRNQVLPSSTPTQIPIPTATPTPIGIPNRIEIPRLSISANVIALGVTPVYDLEVPRDAATVGWFTDSPRPGEKGIALINGHYDTSTGKPAIFYELKNLSIGDEIIVFTAKSDRLVFKIEKVSSEPEKTYSFDDIYGKSDESELRLITCSGIWNKNEKTYSDRLIVFAKLYEQSKV